MISQQQKDGKKTGIIKLKGGATGNSAKKQEVTDGSDMIIDPELEQFSGAHFVPEKHKRDEIRLANSVLPSFK